MRNFFVVVRDFFAKKTSKPHFPAVDFERLEKPVKQEMLRREGKEFVRKYGQVIKTLANE